MLGRQARRHQARRVPAQAPHLVHVGAGGAFVEAARHGVGASFEHGAVRTSFHDPGVATTAERIGAQALGETPALRVRRSRPDEGEGLLAVRATAHEERGDSLRLAGLRRLDREAVQVEPTGIERLVVHDAGVAPEQERPRSARGIGAREEIHRRGISARDLGSHAERIHELARRRAERLILVRAHAIEDQPGGEVRGLAVVIARAPSVARDLHVERGGVGGNGGGGVGARRYQVRLAIAAEQRRRQHAPEHDRWKPEDAARGPIAHLPALPAGGAVVRAGCLPTVGSSSRSIQSLITQRPFFTSR